MKWTNIDKHLVPRTRLYWNNDAFKDFVNLNGFTKFKMGVPYNICKFLNSSMNRYTEKYDGREISKYLSKSYMFVDELSRNCCVVSQPYTYCVSIELIKEKLDKWSEEVGVDVKVYDSRYSWYYPGMTILIIISLPGKEFIVPKIVDYEERK